MLAKIREKTQGIIATLILMFLAIPFILWGIGSYFEGGATPPVAKVNGTAITQQVYRQRLDELQSMNPGRLDSRAMRERVLESMIDQTLLLTEAEDNGYRTGNAQLAQIIKEVPSFQRDGQFEPLLYEAWLRQQRLNPAEFEARLRREYLAVQVQRGLSESAFVTDADMAAMLRLLQQQRRISYALIKTDSLLPKITVSAQEIEEHYQKHQDDFRTPEAVRVEYLTLKASDTAQQIEPSEEELRQAYAAETARYVTPEKRRVSHILIEVPAGAKADAVEAARSKAQDLLKQARSGANFATLAKQHSNDPESAAKGGDLGYVGRGVLPPELEAAVYALKSGEVSEVVQTDYGFHIAKLTEYAPGERRSFEAAKPELIALVRKRKGEERFYELAERFRNLVYEHPETLEVAAKELGLNVATSDWFTRAGGSGIAAQPRVVAAAFEPEVLSRERNSDAIEIDPETVVAVRVIDHRPAAVRPLAEVRGEIERLLKVQRAHDQALALAGEWMKQLESGKRLPELAREIGATFVASKTVTREKPEGVDRRVLTAAFAAPRPKDQPLYGHVDLGQEGAAVYALEAVQDGDPAKADPASKARVRQQLLQRHGADYFASYRAGLRKSADVKINADQL